MCPQYAKTYIFILFAICLFTLLSFESCAVTDKKMHFVANFCNNFHHYLTYRLDLERLFHVKQRLKKHKLLHSYPLYI